MGWNGSISISKLMRRRCGCGQYKDRLLAISGTRPMEGTVRNQPISNSDNNSLTGRLSSGFVSGLSAVANPQWRSNREAINCALRSATPSQTQRSCAVRIYQPVAQR